ncbi:hypothetical protein KP509_24G007100 [Ceratopteris richardii]|nr:hypothetical protein KP509_24G007100 [Ceratopteris richardii]
MRAAERLCDVGTNSEVHSPHDLKYPTKKCDVQTLQWCSLHRRCKRTSAHHHLEICCNVLCIVVESALRKLGDLLQCRHPNATLALQMTKSTWKHTAKVADDKTLLILSVRWEINLFRVHLLLSDKPLLLDSHRD